MQTHGQQHQVRTKHSGDKGGACYKMQHTRMSMSVHGQGIDRTTMWVTEQGCTGCFLVFVACRHCVPGCRASGCHCEIFQRNRLTRCTACTCGLCTCSMLPAACAGTCLQDGLHVHGRTHSSSERRGQRRTMHTPRHAPAHTHTRTHTHTRGDTHTCTHTHTHIHTPPYTHTH